MSFPRYPKYKASGVEWLGDVPEHWEVKRLKYVAALSMGQSPSSDDCNSEGNGLPFLQGNADFGDAFPFARSFCPIPAKVAGPGDILFSVRAPVGAINTADQEYGIGRGLCAITARENTFPRYLRHELEVIKVELFSVATGSTYEAVSTQQVGNTTFVLPPLPEQTAIAAFLDQEAAKIDALIAEQRRLIELLKEKRQAVISHAVTKGLDPKAPMKPSGVEWLGDVPEHWSVSALKYNVSTINGFGFSSLDFCDQGVPLIRAGNIKNKSLTQPEVFLHKEIVDKYPRVILVSGDIVISMVGSDPKVLDSAVGQVGVVPESLAGAVPNQNVVILREVPNVFVKRYLFFTLCSAAYRNHLDVFSHKLANQSIISSSLLVCAKMTYPKIEEQQSIIDFLDNQLEMLDTLTTEAQRAIDLLQERRTALISAAVTGQIDVRNITTKETA